jgi:hypothetical protein
MKRLKTVRRFGGRYCFLALLLLITESLLAQRIKLAKMVG